MDTKNVHRYAMREFSTEIAEFVRFHCQLNLNKYAFDPYGKSTLS